MLAGIRVTYEAIIAGGTLVFIALVLQVLLGSRVIKLKGRLHWRVHRYLGYALVALGAGHAIAALALLGKI
jgi:hypothetical protein